MTKFGLRIVNEHFDQSAEMDAPDVMRAWQKAIASTVTIAADTVSHGAPFFGAEVTLTEGDRQIGRYIVSAGATPLKTDGD